MAENVEDPIEESALYQEKVHSTHGEDGDSILRVVSRKSTRGGEDIKWAEEVRKSKCVRPRDSAETVVGDPEEDRGNLPLIWSH